MNFETQKVKVYCRIGNRHATNLANEANKLDSEIRLCRDKENERRVNMKSVLGLLSLNIYPCEKVNVIVSNIDDNQAKEDLQTMIYHLKNMK